MGGIASQGLGRPTSQRITLKAVTQIHRHRAIDPWGDVVGGGDGIGDGVAFVY